MFSALLIKPAHKAFDVETSSFPKGLGGQSDTCANTSTSRFKVPWPFTAREIVLEAYAIDYLVKDVLIVLMKTVGLGLCSQAPKLRGQNAADICLMQKEFLRSRTNVLRTEAGPETLLNLSKACHSVEAFAFCRFTEEDPGTRGFEAAVK
jgi:hypothetical protein